MKTTDTSIPYLSCDDIRRGFIQFFEAKKHKFIPSSTIAPLDDPTILFTNAGMNQFKSIFLGDNKDGLKRAVNSQKCLRVSGKHNDLEEVGRDGTHHTFFEMLGNWSFGDYYKKEAITWAWELLTEVWKLPKNRLFATVYTNDDEAHSLWEECTDIDPSHIMRFEKDNFWEMGSVGPCGPCSEIHFDLGDLASQKETFQDPILGVNGSNQRYIEIWNLVFMQFERLKNGSLKDLKEKHVDTGSGFERLCMVIQGKTSNYDTDVFTPLIDQISELSGVSYSPDDKGVAHRVIADHLRALSFSIADGVTPGNEGRGYVMRRLLRRASRFAHSLGQEKPFLYKVIPSLMAQMGGAYPLLLERETYITQVIRSEEERFLSTLARGLQKLDKLISSLKKKKQSVISGEDAFLYHDTYGFPYDLTALIAQEQGLEVDEEAYKICMNEQRERARKHARFDDSFTSEESWSKLDAETTTVFTGYESLEDDVRTLRYFEKGDNIFIITDKTPFYAEAGGQVGDIGTFRNKELAIKIVDTFKVLDMHIHKGQLLNGLISNESMKSFKATVDLAQRVSTRRNHSATHILHSCLRTQIGNHVEQQGSFVGPDYLRFDFSHHKALSAQELQDIEDWVNERIMENNLTRTRVMGLEDAKKSGAIALFGEKYSDNVRVLDIGSFSTELCGGTHVGSTGEIGLFSITSESSISAGVRRIEATTGVKALAEFKQAKRTLDDLGQSLKCDKDSLGEKLNKVLSRLKHTQKDLDELHKKNLRAQLDRFITKHQKEVSGVQMVVGKLSANDFSKDHLQEVVDTLSDTFKNHAAFLTHSDGTQLALLSVVGKPVLEKVHAGELIKELSVIAGGRGGGRPNKARAGSKHPEREDEVLKAARTILETKLSN